MELSTQSACLGLEVKAVNALVIFVPDIRKKQQKSKNRCEFKYKSGNAQETNGTLWETPVSLQVPVAVQVLYKIGVQGLGQLSR